MRETQPDRAAAGRPQAYRVNVGAAPQTLERRVEMLVADINRLIGDIAIRLDRAEQRLTALEKKE